MTLKGLSVESAGVLAAWVTPFRELRDNAAISENQWGTDKELIKELWRYLQFLIPIVDIRDSRCLKYFKKFTPKCCFVKYFKHLRSGALAIV